MSHLTRASGPGQPRMPAWQRQIRETFPMPCMPAEMLGMPICMPAVPVVLGSGRVDLVPGSHR
jgi:hypothetical protein